MCSMCIVELHVTVKYVKMFSIAQKCSIEGLRAGISEMYLGIHINFPIFLSDFN